MIKYYYRSLRKAGILKRLQLTVQKKVNGKIVHLPILFEAGLNGYLNGFDDRINQVLMIVLNSSEFTGSFLDVGVNLGQTLLKVKTIDPGRTYLGFEPNPFCLTYLNKLVEKNVFERVTIYPIGLSDRDAVLSLQLYEDIPTSSSASLVKNFRPHSTIKSELPVPVFRLDKMNLSIPIDSVIKIDVEGAELEVILGMQKTLEQVRPLLLMEILPVYTQANSQRLERQQSLLSYLKSLDYLLFSINEHKVRTHFLEQIDSISIHNDMERTNYLFIPAGKEQVVESLLG